MSHDLFKHILANSFEDTAEDIQWLFENGFIEYYGKLSSSDFLYVNKKDFGYVMPATNDSKFIRSKHYVGEFPNVF